MAHRRAVALFVSCVTLLACAPRVGTAELTAATLREPIDASRIAAETGGEADVAGSVVQVTFPRDDVSVEIDGWKRVPAAMGLASWVAFAPANKPGVEAIVSGDLALFEDEVDATIDAAIDHGLDVTALGSRFLFEAPAMRFLHVSGEGPALSLAKAVRATMNAQREVRKRSPHPRSSLFGATVPTNGHVDRKTLDAILDARGVETFSTYRATLVPATMGEGTWTAFAGIDGDTIATGDFAATEAALQPVIRALHNHGFYVVAIRADATPGPTKRFIVSYWARGVATTLASTIKHAVDVMITSY